MMFEDPEQLCLGIDENAALVIENGTAWVISGDDVAQCYLKCCIRTEDGYDIVAHAISESHAPIPLENLLSSNVQWDNTSPTG
jgi:cyanophycinase-like exopeptidase